MALIATDDAGLGNIFIGILVIGSDVCAAVNAPNPEFAHLVIDLGLLSGPNHPVSVWQNPGHAAILPEDFICYEQNKKFVALPYVYQMIIK